MGILEIGELAPQELSGELPGIKRIQNKSFRGARDYYEDSVEPDFPV